MKIDKFIIEMDKIFENCKCIIKKKNADYSGKDTDFFKNFELVEKLNICSLPKGILVRISDKISRITNLINTQNDVEDETINDTILDLINYAIILTIYLKGVNK